MHLNDIFSPLSIIFAETSPGGGHLEVSVSVRLCGKWGRTIRIALARGGADTS
jgi:hypothetical protein